MSFIEDDFRKFTEKMKDLGKLNQDLQEWTQGKPSSTEEKPSSSNQKDKFYIPLSKREIKAFEGLCAMEGKSPKDKVAELIKNYLEQKRKQMGE